MPNSSNLVIFKGKKDGIIIMLDGQAPFKDIKTALGTKAADASRFFGNAKTAISFQGRPLSEDEETQLLTVLTRSANLDVSFVADNLYKTAPANDTKTAAGADALSPQARSDLPAALFLSEHITKFHDGALRSGQSIRYGGSVVVRGDVNPGAEVIAEGNIIILGAAMGLLHAGSGGNTGCSVAAFSLVPIQLRIADIITTIPKEMLKTRKNQANPCYAYVKNGQIYIAPLLNN